jgi:hypothetical protein
LRLQFAGQRGIPIVLKLSFDRAPESRSRSQRGRLSPAFAGLIGFDGEADASERHVEPNRPIGDLRQRLLGGQF